MIPDFKTVLNFVWKARSTWFNLGLQLNIEMEELQSIGQKFNHDSENCLQETLLRWLQMTDPTPSWEDLATALEGDCIDYYFIASEIREKFEIPNRPSTSCELCEMSLHFRSLLFGMQVIPK